MPQPSISIGWGRGTSLLPISILRGFWWINLEAGTCNHYIIRPRVGPAGIPIGPSPERLKYLLRRGPCECMVEAVSPLFPYEYSLHPGPAPMIPVCVGPPPHWRTPTPTLAQPASDCTWRSFNVYLLMGPWGRGEGIGGHKRPKPPILSLPLPTGFLLYTQDTPNRPEGRLVDTGEGIGPSRKLIYLSCHIVGPYPFPFPFPPINQWGSPSGRYSRGRGRGRKGISYAYTLPLPHAQVTKKIS